MSAQIRLLNGGFVPGWPPPPLLPSAREEAWAGGTCPPLREAEWGADLGNAGREGIFQEICFKFLPHH